MDKRNSELSIHVMELPSEGLELTGEVSFCDLDIAEDEFTRLPCPMAYHLHLSMVGEDLLVRGHLHAVVELMCDRCAEFSRHELSTADVCHRYENVAGDVVDLTEGLREDILIVFPQTHLCSPDCKGLCPHCGQNLNEGECDCASGDGGVSGDGEAEESAGPNPWAALDNFKF